MATNRIGRDPRLLFRAVRAETAEGQTDGQLLARFVARRDEAAFTALVRRHGPMVLGVCRRVLGNAADAEDAFQATFIVLLRKAAALSKRAVLGDYLHGVARRTALKARVNAARRRAKEQRLVRATVPSAEGRNDWLPRLDEELCRLPEKYRLPVVLCDLEGKTRREAAGQLGWPEGTVAGRLARGRALLAKRLLRGATAGELPETLVSSVLQTALPAGLVGSTVQAVASAAAGKTTASAGAVTLAQGVLQTMLWNKLKLGAVVLLACVVTAGVGGVTYRVAAGDGQVVAAGPETNPPAENPPAAVAAPKAKPPIVQEIDLKGFRPWRATDVMQQTIITGVDQLVQAIPDKEWQVKINDQVDFEAQRLLYFLWPGSPDDKLSYRLDDGKTGPVVVFRYTRGAVATNTVTHAHLFALAKNVGFKVEGDETTPPPAVLAVREIDLKGYKAGWKSGSVFKPFEIAGDEELAKVLACEPWEAKIARQVDFAKERLVLFSWLGGNADEFTFTSGPGKTGPVVVFHYVAGKAKEVTLHLRLYAVAKEASWSVEEKGARRLPAEPPAPNKDDSTAKLLKDLDSDNVVVQAAASDLLGWRKAKEAIPRLIELVGDGTALPGSDNYVGLHAANALVKITGQHFGVDEKKWQAWWKEQQKEAAGPGVATDSAVKVLSAEATVELRGLLVHTPKGTFVMVREQRPFAGAPGGEKETEAVTWELDYGKKAADLEQQAKALSGTAVVVNGTCKMVSALTYGASPLHPSLPSGSEWRLEKIVTVSRLSAAEKR